MTNPSKLDYFCDHTMRRYMAQVLRAFSGFQYESFPQGIRTLNTVPCLAAQTDAMVAAIISNASDTTLSNVPVISVTQTGVQGRREDLKHNTHIDERGVTERLIVDGKYTDQPGRSYSVQRMMPRPFTMLFNVDVWTSNDDQKQQIFEQMATIFYPAIQIQNSENPLDWGAETYLEMEDSINWNSRAIPVGTDTGSINYFTLSFKLDIWLNPPARVNQLRRIEQIVTNIHNVVGRHGEIEGAVEAQVITTPGDHFISVSNGVITLLNSKAGLHDANMEVHDWAPLIKSYGNMRPGTSTIRLSTTDDIEAISTDIVGTIQYNSERFNELSFTVDPSTLPLDTLAPIAGVVDPRTAFPGQRLPGQTIGQRYLITNDIGGPNQAWGNLHAKQNDIIQFDGSNWTVAYRPIVGADAVGDHVTNTNTGRQLRWNEAGWVLTFDGIYAPGRWRLHV